MMPILPSFELMPFAEIPVGALVAIEDGGTRSVGICLEQLPQDTSIGIIIDQEIEQPYIRFLQSDTKLAMVLATDGWIMEPTHGDMSFPYQGHTYPRAAGLLRLCADGWHMNFATSYPDQLGRFNMEWWNIKTMAKAGRATSDYALFSDWRVWLSQAQRNNSPDEPFLKFTAIQAKPAA